MGCQYSEVNGAIRMNQTIRTGSVPSPAAHYPVMVQMHPVSWDDIEAETGARVLEIGRRKLTGSFYLCPRFTVSCAEPTPAFFRKARTCQAAWCRTMSQVLGPSNRRRAARRVSPIERQLVFTGILVIDGNHIDPREWKTFGFSPAHRSVKRLEETSVQ